MEGYENFTKEKILYLYKATKPIKYKKLQDRIYFELSNHIDDMFCDYIEDGMNEEDATDNFLYEMGNPEKLGEELKKTHRKTLRLAKVLKCVTVLAVFALIISAFGFFESKNNLKVAKAYELPEETVALKKSLLTYTELEEYSILNDVCWYTNIDWYDWNTTKPLYKVKEYNLFNDYYILDENQSVVIDLGYAMHGVGKIHIDDINKLPQFYHSDKISKIVLFNYRNELTITPNLTPNEVLELEKLAILNDNDTKEELEIEELVLSNENDACCWMFQFHIKDLEGLYYTSDYSLYKSTNGKYYVGTYKLFSDGDACIYQEIPEYIGVKIDKAFEDAWVKFEDSENRIHY